MGFELLAIITSQNFNILSSCDSENITMPLNFTSYARKSNWLSYADDTIYNILQKESGSVCN
jgi:hypothetical protein